MKKDLVPIFLRAMGEIRRLCVAQQHMDGNVGKGLICKNCPAYVPDGGNDGGDKRKLAGCNIRDKDGYIPAYWRIPI